MSASVQPGRAWVFPANVTTDDILPGRYLDRGLAEVGQFAMAGIAPDFAARVGAGDFVVAGANFGAGSGRESAPAALKAAGVAAVIATSVARVFYRNCVNLGLPALVVDSIEGIATGDELIVELGRAQVRHLPSGSVRAARNLSGIAFEILEAGGIVAFTRARRAAAGRP